VQTEFALIFGTFDSRSDVGMKSNLEFEAEHVFDIRPTRAEELWYELRLKSASDASVASEGF
jgi:hypothetical protein